MEKYSVVFATDQNYIQHLAVALKSLLVNNKKYKFCVYIINGGIENKEWQELIKILSGNDCELKSILIDDKIFEKLVTNHHFTKANYYRLLIPNFIDEEKVLYLDADIVINNDIGSLYNIDLDKNYIASVENPGFDRHDELKMELTSKYFNSGVMLINNKLWKDDDISNKVIQFVDDHQSVIKFVDQCGLNAVINGKWIKIPLKFNQQAVVFEKDFKEKYNCFSDDELNEAKENPVIIHYTGSSKPWHFRNKHPYKHLYWKYLKMTPFKRYIPEDFTVLNVIKWMIPNKIKETIKGQK